MPFIYKKANKIIKKENTIGNNLFAKYYTDKKDQNYLVVFIVIEVSGN